MENGTLDARRVYSRRYDRDHRIKLRGKARERYRARISKVGVRALKAAREDPRYEEGHGIRAYVVCRVSGCGAKAKSVTPAHLRGLHKLTTEQYMSEFPGAPLASLALRKKQSAAMRSGPPRLPRVPGHPGEEPLRTWLIVELAWKGKMAGEIGRDVDRHGDTVRRIVSKLGMGPPRLHDLGMPVTNAYVLRLLKATGLNSREFAEIFEISRMLAADILRPRSAQNGVAPARARSIIAVRDRHIREITGLARTAGHRWGPNSTRILRSLVPDFRSICQTLRKALTLTRRFLREKPVSSILDWQDWLCDEARREIDRRLRVRPFSALLPIAAELSPFIEPQLDALRGPGRIQRVEVEVLAARFGVPRSCCIHAKTAHPLSPLRVRNWILATRLRQLTVSMPAGKPRERGRPEGISPMTRRRLRHLAAILKLGRSLRGACALVYPDAPASAESSTYALRSKHRNEIDREAETLTSSEAEALLRAPVKLA
jgi:hypothetical protein